MTDNVHGVGVNDVAESAEQDAIKVKTDLITITSSINLDTVGSNQTNFTNQLSGASSSGLKTLITGNDTDIDNINDKLDMTTSSNMKTAIDLNTAKVTFPGIGTTASTCLAGNTTTISATQASKITANENAITAIENKTDFITITQSVNLDTVENDTLNNLLDVASIKTKTDNITVNGDDIYFGDKNIGINTTNPNCSLEIGDSSSVERIRLNGANGLAISSELLFTDAFK